MPVEMGNLERNTEIEQLRQQIELEESNYKAALSLRVSIIVLKSMREKIKELKNTLQLTINKSSELKSGDLLNNENLN